MLEIPKKLSKTRNRFKAISDLERMKSVFYFRLGISNSVRVLVNSEFQRNSIFHANRNLQELLTEKQEYPSPLRQEYFMNLGSINLL